MIGRGELDRLCRYSLPRTKNNRLYGSGGGKTAVVEGLCRAIARIAPSTCGQRLYALVLSSMVRAQVPGWI